MAKTEHAASSFKGNKYAFTTSTSRFATHNQP